MSETETKQKAPVNPAEAFESLTLLAYRWTGLIEASSIMSAHGLTVPSFAVLAAAAAEPGTGAGKLARKAGLSKGGAGPAVRALKTAGLIDETRPAEGKGRMLTPTETGRKALEAVRVDMAALATQLPEANWRAIPRVAATTRRVAKILNADKAAAAESADEGEAD